MIILGIDPGTTKSGFALYNTIQTSYQPIRTWTAKNEEVIKQPERSGCNIDIVGIEMPDCQGRTQVGGETFETCRWIGRYEQKFVEAGIPVAIVYRRDLKKHYKAWRKVDSTIRTRLIQRFEPELKGNERPKGVLKGVKGHEWQALAVAVYVADKEATNGKD